MKYEDYKSKINEVLSNPDTALANLEPVMEEIKNDLTALDSVSQENEGLKARIRDLQDTNMKLYLAQTGEAAEEETEEPAEGPAVIDEFLSSVFEEEED